MRQRSTHTLLTAPGELPAPHRGVVRTRCGDELSLDDVAYPVGLDPQPPFDVDQPLGQVTGCSSGVSSVIRIVATGATSLLTLASSANGSRSGTDHDPASPGARVT